MQTAHTIGSHGFEPISHLLTPSHSAEIVRKIVRREHQCYKRPLPVCLPARYRSRSSPSKSQSSAGRNWTESNLFGSAWKQAIRDSVSVHGRSCSAASHSGDYPPANSSTNGRTANLYSRSQVILITASLLVKTALFQFSSPLSRCSKRARQFDSGLHPKC